MQGSRDHEEARPEAVVAQRYAVRREIARGGMGAVFEAEHLVSRAKVALKTLIQPALSNAAAQARLLREARVLGAIRHPNVVAVYDAGTCPRHGPFVALEMIEGRPLDGILLARQRLPVTQTVAMAAQLCAALETVHRSGVVHRDIKPSNILIASTPVGDHLELIDFGVATLGPPDPQARSLAQEPRLTKQGELLGTVEYMAPEQLTGQGAIDERSDVYALGVTLYECLAGEVPFGGSPTAVIASLVSGAKPPPLRAKRADVPIALENAVRTALELDPARRFASAQELFLACASAIGGALPRLELLEARRDREGLAPQPQDPARRRNFVRAPYVAPVRLVLAGGTCDGRTEDISEGGVLVVVERECARDQDVTLRMPLPSSGRVVSLAGTTRWVKHGGSKRAIGVELRDPPADVREDIRAYVANMSGSPSALAR